MKRLKNLFIFVLCLCFVPLVGCGKDPEKPNEPTGPVVTTITLAEAKETILNALKVDEVSNADTTADESDNRDLLKKFVNFSYNEIQKTISPENEVVYDSKLIANAKFVNNVYEILDITNSVDSENDNADRICKYYSPDGEVCYYFDVLTNGKSLGLTSTLYFGYSPMRNFYKFTDEIFDILGGEVTKTSIDNKFYLNLKVEDIKGFYMITSAGDLSSEMFDYLYENDNNFKTQIDNCVCEINFEFIDDEIIYEEADLSTKYLDEQTDTELSTETYKLKIEKLESEPVTPEWYQEQYTEDFEINDTYSILAVASNNAMFPQNANNFDIANIFGRFYFNRQETMGENGYTYSGIVDFSDGNINEYSSNVTSSENLQVDNKEYCNGLNLYFYDTVQEEFKKYIKNQNGDYVLPGENETVVYYNGASYIRDTKYTINTLLKNINLITKGTKHTKEFYWTGYDIVVDVNLREFYKLNNGWTDEDIDSQTDLINMLETATGKIILKCDIDGKNNSVQFDMESSAVNASYVITKTNDSITAPDWCLEHFEDDFPKIEGPFVSV